MNNTEAQEARYEQILGEDNIDTSKESMMLYCEYLEEHIIKPCELTGLEVFKWEDYYILGPGDKKEYEELKKTRPSYKDLYNYMSFDDLIDDTEGLMVRVRRLSDKKQFVLPLSYLEVTDNKSPNYQLINDYAVWYVNY